jgi:decaprenyl-phosphate phosphoribosyltransferase
MNELLRTARPNQWLKNVLVFGAPGAAGVLDSGSDLARTFVAFVAFCVASSGTYFWNDVLDLESDRAHPIKCHRPIAAGAVSLRRARIVGSVLPVVALLLTALTGRWQTTAIVGLYSVVTLSYSASWKRIIGLDVVAVAVGFVLRAVGGAVAVDVPMSKWFLLVTTFGSLFVVTGKRYAERRDLGAEAASIRSTLGGYSQRALQIVLVINAVAAVASYWIWAFETKESSGTDLPYYELSIIPVTVAFARYFLVLERGYGAAPEEVFGGDRFIQVVGLVWIVVYGFAVYL